jgi:hypothetical protein
MGGASTFWSHKMGSSCENDGADEGPYAAILR